MTLKLTKPWWLIDNYTDEKPFPLAALEPFWGPQGIAAVRAWPDGRTSPGWGGEEFISNYAKKAFDYRRIVPGYVSGDWAFAFVMRSMRIVVIDIDGKNGGIEHASELLGNAPRTLSEVSKSGTGYHLFYEVDDTWDASFGFATYADHIGIVQGVDIRGTGCVYHYPQQRWNDAPVAKLPAYIGERLLRKQTARASARTEILKALEMDPMDLAIKRDELLDELAKPIKVGSRNNALFALGSKLYLAQVPDWEDRLSARAVQVGLPDDEIDKLIKNIPVYADKPQP